MDKKIRLLKASEIEVRASTINERGVSLLLYKDARVDQRILDETFGLFGWKRTHQSIDGNLYCTVEVLDNETNQWISKQDVGISGYAEKEKSQASDSFKRACVNIGIGRELYTAPFIWIPASKTTIQQKDGKYYCNGRFNVKAIKYNDDREITDITITNENGIIVFELKSKEKESVITANQRKSLDKELRRTGVGIEEVTKRYNCDENTITTGIYKKAMTVLKQMDSAA